MALITLTTDFGTRDHYVGVMKGVIYSIAPQADVVDITHDIEAHNITHGALVLRSIWPWFPEGTIHVIVVDPGVGSERRVLLGRYKGRYVIAPDNGLITLVHRSLRLEEMRVVENQRYLLSQISSTFHGRDILAPVAAHLANGVKSEEFGRPTDHLAMLPATHSPDTLGRRIRGQVIYVDRFGSLVTNISRQDLAGLPLGKDGGAVEVFVNDVAAGPVRSFYEEVAIGEVIALLGSTDYLEIAVNQGRAIERFGPVQELKIEVR
jgi:S-adenosylmethionine hydrolase